MTEPVRGLEPRALWNYFADLNAIPRASNEEQQAIEFARKFGEQLGLDTSVDATGNVIIRKPATAGMEDRVPVVLQSHLDMVHQKNSDSDFDFATEGIRMIVEGDWVRAEGTTLGADNGIGVGSILALLAADNIPHPPLEALLTIDEESGMTGAKGLQPGVLEGKILLNLDTEDDQELTIGCAGGKDLVLEGTCQDEPADGLVGRLLSLGGLQGGHSGIDIHLGLGNSNKLMNRILMGGAEKFGLRVSTITGGGLRNVIPRESTARVGIPTEMAAAFDQWYQEQTRKICNEYVATDPECRFQSEQVEVQSVIDLKTQASLLNCVDQCLHGIHKMCPAIVDLVQSSNNLARVVVGDGKFSIASLVRSNLDVERDELAESISELFRTTGGQVESPGSYPGWEPTPESAIVKLMTGIYEQMFGEKPQVLACHAGLECGLLSKNFPGMQMISFGPNIRGAHSPDETVQISSVQKFWSLLLNTLTQIPAN